MLNLNNYNSFCYINTANENHGILLVLVLMIENLAL